MKKVSKKQLESKLSKAITKRDLLIVKKDKCVDDQSHMENEFFSYELTDNRKYNKLVDLDFDLADKIDDINRVIKNLKARIYRRKKKDEEIRNRAELKEQGIILHNKQSTIYNFC